MLFRKASAAAQSFDSNPKEVPLANGIHLPSLGLRGVK
jgi:hypothetical protein